MIHRTRLKEVVNKMGMTQMELAHMASISPSTMAYLINGKTLPNLRTAQQIATVLGVSIDYLWPTEGAQDYLKNIFP